MPKKNVSFNIDTDDLVKLDEYAANLERDRSYVLNQAVKLYIAQAEEEAAEDEAAIAAIERGESIPHEEILPRLRERREQWEKYLAEKRATTKRKAS